MLSFPDLIPVSELQFYKKLGWNPLKQYSEFIKATKDVLDFNINTGISISANKMNLENFKAEYLIGLNPKLSCSMGYMASTIKIPSLETNDFNFNIVNSAKPNTTNPDQLESSFILKNIRRRIWSQKSDINIKQFISSSESMSKIENKPEYLLYAQAYPSERAITGTMIKQYGKNSQMKLSWMSIADEKRTFNVVGHYSVVRDRWNTDFSFGSVGQMYGTSGVYNFPKMKNSPGSNFCFGYELYYGGKEGIGGLSIGLKKQVFPIDSKTKFSEQAILLNPVLGHISTNYCQQINRNLVVATKYNYNFYSRLSQLAFGFEFLSPEKRISTSTGILNYILKFSFQTIEDSLDQIGSAKLVFEKQFLNFVASVGMSFCFDQQTSSNETVFVESSNIVSSPKSSVTSISRYENTGQIGNPSYENPNLSSSTLNSFPISLQNDLILSKPQFGSQGWKPTIFSFPRLDKFEIKIQMFI
ncbi:hypothetical protein BB558_002984 [Smittium angustum]|uniref:Mitochondrial distribution and morphology protein 10 n=1 Tax=Smittium angustum TaxID=133377 RepID=A0A2U1J784_SMIAN|nr:hypothetical protein BB558_002984 [Smittium angustum]